MFEAIDQYLKDAERRAALAREPNPVAAQPAGADLAGAGFDKPLPAAGFSPDPAPIDPACNDLLSEIKRRLGLPLIRWNAPLKAVEARAKPAYQKPFAEFAQDVLATVCRTRKCTAKQLRVLKLAKLEIPDGTVVLGSRR